VDIFLFSNANNCIYRYSIFGINKSGYSNPIIQNKQVICITLLSLPMLAFFCSIPEFKYCYSQLKIPITRPVMHEARVAATRDLNATDIKVSFISGHIAEIPEINIPTDDRFANPHNAYIAINFDLSDINPESISAKAAYATNSLRAVLIPNNSAT
jgi:hypothetical protein